MSEGVERFLAEARPAESGYLAAVAPSVTCPNCRVEVPHGGAWVTWCDRCDWNVSGGREPKAKTGLRRIQAGIVGRAAEQLHAEMVGHGSAERAGIPAGAAFVVAVLVSVAVLGSVLALAAVAVWVAVVPDGWWHWPLAVLSMSVSVAVLPRPNRLPDDVVELSREEAPHTWRLVDEVSHRLGLRPPAVLGVDPHLNAWVARTGWRHRSTLVLGVPFWTLLDSQEKVALLGHELGHVRHGDPVGSVPVWAALSVLSRVRGLLHAEDIWWDGGSLGLFTPAINVLKWLLRMPANGALILLWLCTARYSQRAEYRADVASARLSGSEAAASLMIRLLGMEGTEVRVGASVRRGAGPWRVLEGAGHVPARELERLVRAGAREGHQVDSMHPPTHLRLDLVRSVPPSAEPYLVAADLEQGVERELAAIQARLTRRVEDALRYA